ncbi:phenylacetic acid degradation protein PaaN [Halioglobus japonicus]|uniref:Phenylacetic acid degradation protein PaaN n=1 Tax=Halioglobus japonicus TaxID=930805 RepID=A0AAP8MD29_9GAMM|nr:phenylacetic acid degradation protein PaaN [Halioglobus japonicus]AQA17653.1 phenylacetic acid degradation protein PaaN [Halioglobus japonicus]PLW85598.1 phenylacetic acid degradation protein PaaN [Halioglobus japonicus]GHD16463.1 phenylacetic acid degradation protein PaaN [Halioglobus japonicus]
MTALMARHRPTLYKAIDACNKRYSWTAYPESPSSKIWGAKPPVAGKENFEAMLGSDYPLNQPGEVGRTGAEVSPYTGEPLDITYPKTDIDTLYEAIAVAMPAWRDANPETRLGICLEILDRCAGQLFENAHATMHTSGQSYIMAFAGSGANALDRGLEALAYAAKAMADVPATAQWERQFGKSGAARLDKKYRLMPRGVGVVICCATFPLWNGYPALCASLATGNPVVLKPHPAAILPVALLTTVARQVLEEEGFDPNLVSMVADTRDAPATMALLEHPMTAIVDFTGSPAFGEWIEQHCSDKLVYTETAGCNSVVIESCENLEAMAGAIAHSLCQASAQMCTSVQNIHVPAGGIRVGDGHASFDEVAAALVAAVDKHLHNPQVLCGTLVDEAILATIERYRGLAADHGQLLRDSGPLDYADFPGARTASPLMLEVTEAARDIYRDEIFGPVSFVIKGADAEACLRDATTNARERGAITSHVYSLDEAFLDRAEMAYHNAGASVACNLIGMPINFAAAYSDYHVSGLNPAGNACLADLAFVASRFRIVQSKRM